MAYAISCDMAYKTAYSIAFNTASNKYGQSPY